MKSKKTDNLKKVPQDQNEAPEIYAANADGNADKISRKTFLKTIGALGVSAAALTSNPLQSSARQAPGDDTGFNKLKAHSEAVECICFCPDGKTLASASADGTIKLWSMPDGKLLKKLISDAFFVSSICISPDGKLLASLVHGDKMDIWSLPGGTLLKTIVGNAQISKSVSFSPDGKTIAVGYANNKISLWSFPGEKELKVLEFTDYNPGAHPPLSFSPFGNFLASATIGNNQEYSANSDKKVESTVKIWSMPEGKEINPAEEFNNPVHTVCFSPDGKMLASGCDNNTIQLWSVPERRLLKTLTEQEEKGLGGKSLSFSPDGKMLASANAVQIKLWTISDGKLMKTIEGHIYDINSVCFSPDGKILASASVDGTIKLWSIPEGEFLQNLADPIINKPTNIRKINYAGTASSTSITQTLPCGSPIPPGAICTCDCVSVGTYSAPRPSTYSGSTPSTYTYHTHYWHPN